MIVYIALSQINSVVKIVCCTRCWFWMESCLWSLCQLPVWHFHVFQEFLMSQIGKKT